MKAVYPNPVVPSTPRTPALVYFELCNGVRVRVLASDYEKHELGRYRWYPGARGRVVSSLGAERSTVYLSRLLAGAQRGDRVTLRQTLPFALRDGAEEALDYRPDNFRIVRAST